MRPFLYAVLVFAVSAGATGAGAIDQPSLAGSWTLDGFMGRGPLGFRDERAICPLPVNGPAITESHRTGGPSAMSGDTEEVEQLTSLGTFEAEVTVVQSAAEITVDRRYSGSIGTGSHKDVFKLDGTESVTAIGKITSRTKSRWEGATLVVDHHLTWGATPETSCRVRETFSVDSGVLSIVASSNLDGVSWTSRQTYLKKGR